MLYNIITKCVRNYLQVKFLDLGKRIVKYPLYITVMSLEGSAITFKDQNCYVTKKVSLLYLCNITII